MRVNLSWAQKLRALTLLTPLGLAVIVTVVVWGLGTVSASYKAVYDVVTYKVTSSGVLMDWSGLERSVTQLDASSDGKARGDLVSFEENAARLVEQSQQFESAAVIESSHHIAEVVRRYSSLRQRWLNEMNRLESSGGEGARVDLVAAMKELKRLSISLLDEPVEALVAASSQYSQTGDPESQAQAEEAMAALQEMVEEYSWQGSMIGEKLRHFGEVFERTKSVLTSLANLERELGEVGSALQTAVFEQNKLLESGLIKTTMDAAEKAERSAKLASVGSAVVFAPILMVALMLISRTLGLRLNSLVQLLSKVSDGDLTQKLDVGRNSKDEFNVVGRAANQMIDDVSGLLRESVRSTEALMDVRAQLAQTSDRLNRSSESIDDQTDQAATATQEISVTINDVARRTAEVGGTMQDANEAAKSGEVAIRESVATMHRLAGLIADSQGRVSSVNAASAQVTGIIDVIDGLAEQTNLLALNAAIEAARAGDAGRGFSVVSDEVRMLAQKTVSATNNISTLIAELNRATERMDRQMADGQEAAAESVEQANHISLSISQIVKFVEQLTSDMDQVVVAVEQISVTTEDIAQKVEEVRGQTAEARLISKDLAHQSELLSGHANRLEATNSRFQIASV